MAILTLRTVKGTPLTNQEVDDNFSNLNLDIGVTSNLSTTEKSNLVAAINEVYGGGFANVNITGGTITGLANLASDGNVFGNYFLGNGSLLSGISVDSTRILSGNSAVVIVEPDGNILMNVASATKVTADGEGLLVSGNVRFTGQIKDDSGNVLVIQDEGGNVIWGA